ncbi:MAG: molybdate ABC transporter substrate-binding protein [Myxococcota bacterium]
MRRGPVVAALAMAMGVAGGCRCDAGRSDDVQVWAPVSLVDVLPEVAEAWEGRGGEPVAFSFGGTSRLARQVTQGAPADVFIAADERWMDYVAERGAIRPETREAVVHNGLVVVVPAERGRELGSLRDLAAPRVRRLALGNRAVPVGRYAEAALRDAGVWPAVRARVVRAEHTRAALAWVVRGEADAGIVYRSDAMSEPRVRIARAIPADRHPPIVYPAAVTRRASPEKAARAFVRFLSSPEARALFEGAGFRKETP